MGFALEGGVRINKQMWKNIYLFIEGGYASQVVNKLSGPGNETYDRVISSCEGEWGIKEYNITRDWGNLQQLILTNLGATTESCPYKYVKYLPIIGDFMGCRGGSPCPPG